MQAAPSVLLTDAASESSGVFHRALGSLHAFAEIATKAKKMWNLPSSDDKGPGLVPPSLDVFACNHFMELFYVDEGRLKILNLKRLKNTPDGKPSILSVDLSPPLSYPILQILVDDSGDNVALIGKNAISVVEITRRDRAELLEKKPVMCKVRPFGSYYFSTHLSISILKAAWHPLSSKHLVVLSSDNTLRMYHVAREEDPELLIPLHVSANASGAVTMTPSRSSAAYGPRVVTFCFGPPRKGLWSRLTLWMLYDNGDIYALCPVLPIGCLLPVAVLDELALLTEQQLSQLHMAEYEVDPLLFDHFEAQRAWLQQIRGPVVASSREDSADDMASAPEWIRTKAPVSNLLAPLLQGPLNSDRNSTATTPSATASTVASLLSPADLFCLDLVPTVLLRLDRSGVLDSYVLFDGEVDAAWPQSSALSRRLDLVLVDSVDLRFAQSGSKKSIGETMPVIRADTLYADVVYVVHSGGVSRVRLNWLAKLTQMIDSEEDQGNVGEFLAGSASPLVVLTNLSGAVASQPLLQPVLCACLITESALGHMLLVLYNRLVVVDLTAASSLDLQPPLKLSASKSDELQQLKPATGVDPLKAQRPPMLQIHIPNPEEVSLTSAETLTQMMKTTKLLNDRYLIYIYNMNGETKARIDRVNQFKKAQLEELNELQQILQVQEANHNQLREKVALLGAFQKDISGRLDTILEIINSHQQNLSNEEIEYHRELEQANEKLTLLTTKLDEVKKKSERVNVAQQQSQFQLADKQLEKIEPILAQEQAMIQSAVEAVKKLRVDLDDLQPSSGQ